ncbi:MAG: FGGY-family carbohydrate kinase, partial [Acidimicrobiales bacterium]
SVHGRLTAAAATATGLGEGTMVLVGGHDQACAALGLGVIDPGSAFLAAGTAWVLTVVTDRAAIGELPISLNLSPHVLPGRWSASTSLGGMGAAISWWLGQPPGRHSDEVRPPGEPAIAKSSPFFAPAVGDHERRGWGRFERVGPSHGHGHRELAVFEAAAFEVRRALGHILWITGPLDHLVAVGGASANPRLLQVLADVVGLPIRVVGEASWPAVGAARIAATAIGWHLPRSAPERATTSTRTVVPDPAAVAVHTERWTTYRRLSGEEHDQERSGDP